MSIRRNRNATSTTVLETPPAPQPTTPISHPRIDVRTPSEMNGYLDPDQTLVNFAVRELGMSFSKLIAEDPSRLLRNWLKCYKTARSSAIGTLGLGTAALIVGVGVGAWPLSLAGFLTMGGCGLLVKHHNNGVKACELEAEIIDEIRPVLELFHALEVRGANPSDLVSLYDRLIRQYAAQNPAFGLIGDPKHLKEFFETELAKHHTLSGIISAPTGLVTASTIPVQQPAIAPSPAPAAPLPEPQPIPVVQPEPEPAIATDSSSGASEPEPSLEPELETVAVPDVPPPTDLAELLAEQLKSLVIAAFPRTGKGITVAHAGRRVKERIPGLEIWLLDPKNEPGESGYWSFVDMDKRLHFDLRDFSLDISKVETLANDFLARFNDSTASAKLLIVDEFVALNARLSNAFMKRLKDFLVAISSSGESSSGEANKEPQGKFAWIMTQSPYVTDLGFRTKGLGAAFNRILIFNEANLGYVTLAQEADFCPKTDKGQKQQLLTQTSRAFYYSLGDRWEALCNYEGFATDHRTSPNSHPFNVQLVANQQATEVEAEAIADEVATAVFEVEEIAGKLLTWLKGTGQKFFVGGFILGNDILKNFTYRSDSKTSRLNKQELTRLMWHLVHINEAEVIKSKGVRLISGEDDLGLFDDEM
ncbi:hypothetical protein [Leptolyngbya sp. FACHB-16]|uniref:hypothetical protein n=1 Tax=unclassified Leptolyngbya TaxID=2650499 RepID=UPI0016831836|nr:hypothetical protein [Leptolyngbya sp. FACHB-16]MBD2156258.1 hypothetical protein [Leptolyngbya sp. FACHB-16]